MPYILLQQKSQDIQLTDTLISFLILKLVFLL